MHASIKTLDGTANYTEIGETIDATAQGSLFRIHAVSMDGSELIIVMNAAEAVYVCEQLTKDMHAMMNWSPTA